MCKFNKGVIHSKKNNTCKIHYCTFQKVYNQFCENYPSRLCFHFFIFLSLQPCFSISSVAFLTISGLLLYWEALFLAANNPLQFIEHEHVLSPHLLQTGYFSFSGSRKHFFPQFDSNLRLAGPGLGTASDHFLVSFFNGLGISMDRTTK